MDYPQAYIMQYNLTVQKQFGANVFSVGYVGEVGRHLQYAPNINIPAPSPNGLTTTIRCVYSGVIAERERHQLLHGDRRIRIQFGAV